MSASKEVNPKKPAEDPITPHKLTLAILIRNFCTFRNSDSFKLMKDESLKAKYRKDFCVFLLKLLQSPDLSLEELRTVLISKNFNISSSLIKSFDETLAELYNNGSGAMLDIIESLNRIIFSSDPTEKNFFVSKSSIAGYYLRRLIVNFEKLTFSEVTTVYLAFQRYYESWQKCKTVSISSNNVINIIDDWSANRNQWSRRQAELFIATQAALLTNNEEKALEPKELQQRISNLLSSNPSLSQAHFLLYINYLRVKEFCGAMNSLYHCFDRNTTLDSKANNDEKSKIYRFAVLNLAILYYKFDHKEKALTALKEAIKISQAANDNVCLQHALSWLYRLSVINKDKLIQHSVSKSFELNISHIMCIGIQSFVQIASLMAFNPLHIFETITKSDIINCDQSLRHLIPNNYAVKSALWQFYGKSEMSSLWIQLLFYLNINCPREKDEYYGEGFCIGICHMANQLLYQGNYNLVYTIINFAKERFIHEPNSYIWMFCENLFIFIRALHHENWNIAQVVAQKIIIINKWEGYIRMAELYYYKNDYEQASLCINIVINRYLIEEKNKFKNDYYIRAKILSAQIQFAIGFPNNIPNGIVTLLTNCLIETNKLNMDYYTALINLHIANIKFLLGLTSEAIKLLERCLIQILSHGGNFDRATAILLYVKCILANSATLNNNNKKRQNIFKNCLKMLNQVKENFLSVEAYSRTKDVLYLQAHLYNLLDMKLERNKCSLEFRLLNEEYKTKNLYTLEKYL